ncbi:hypothetical protein NPIL_398631, partial [Nephila pilipes]
MAVTLTPDLRGVFDLKRLGTCKLETSGDNSTCELQTQKLTKKNGYTNVIFTVSTEICKIILLYSYEFKLDQTTADVEANFNQVFGGGATNERIIS